MVIQFTLQELMIFLVLALAIAIGVFLISILWNIKKMVSILRPIVEKNKEAIKTAVETVPQITENVRQISDNLKETTDNLNASLPVILQNVESVTNAAQGSIETIGTVIDNLGFEPNDIVDNENRDTHGFTPYLHIIENVLQIIDNIFLNKK